LHASGMAEGESSRTFLQNSKSVLSYIVKNPQPLCNVKIKIQKLEG